MLVTNPTVYDLYGEQLRGGLGVDDKRLVLGMVPDGEEYKTMVQAQRLIDLAVEHHFDRSSLVITLGGGVIGDLGGLWPPSTNGELILCRFRPPSWLWLTAV